MHPRSQIPPGLCTLLLTATALVTGQSRAAPDPSTLDPARVGWSEIRMTAAKLFLTADARLSLRLLPGEAVARDLLPLPEGPPVGAGSEVLELVYDAAGAGRRSQVTLLMDPASGAAIQQTVQDLEGKLRYRTYRFGTLGAYQRTRWPAAANERSSPPAKWTRTSEGLRIYPVDPQGQPVLESTGLLYAIAAAPLEKPGDQVELLVFRRRDTQAVQVEVLPPREIIVQYDELWPKGTVQRKGKVQPIRLALRAVPAPGPAGTQDKKANDELEVLGLRGELELALDPETRTPLQLSGRVKILGQVTLRLAAVRLR